MMDSVGKICLETGHQLPLPTKLLFLRDATNCFLHTRSVEFFIHKALICDLS